MHCTDFYRLLAIIPAFFLSTHAWATPRVIITTVPDWVLPVKPGGHNPATKDIAEGYFISLYDTQTHVEKQASFVRLVREIRTSTGVQNGSEISIYFDPTYQQLSLHEVVVIREGKRINKLTQKSIKLEPYENERSNFIYNGAYVASLLLTDIRPNDQIAYSYTLTGRNPIFGKHFAQTYYFSSSDPLPNRRQAILVDVKRKLSFRSDNNSPKLIITKQGDLVVYDWQAYDIKPGPTENYVPGWVNTEARVQVSDWQQWADVSAWAMTITGTPLLPPGMRPLVDQWAKKANGNALRYSKQAVAFVQDEIRYVGIELGENSHRPHAPDQIYQQRYGDCKDKSLLLCTLLQAYGIQANMALTNSYLSTSMPNHLPDPNVFNHAIVRAKIGNKIVWIDPTITNQRGEKNDFYCPAYSYALVVKAGEHELQTIPYVNNGHIEMNETYWIPSSLAGDKPGYLGVHTFYSGHCADDIRGTIAHQGKAALDKTYLDYYQQSMSNQIVTAEQPLYEEDDPTKNTFVTQERYTLANLWQADSGSAVKTLTLYCRAFAQELRSLTARQRINPLSLTYPYEIDYTVRIHLPEIWTVEPDNWRIDRKAYICNFEKTYQPADSLVLIHFTYKNKLDHVEIADIAAYRADINKIDGDLSLQLTQDPSAKPSDEINWLMVLSSLITIFLGIYIGWQLYQRDILPTLSPPSLPIPIGGWLIVLSISLPIGLISLTNELTFSSVYYQKTVQTGLWYLGGTKGYVGIAVLYIENTINWLLWCGSVLCTILFFQRRTTFPRYFTVLLFSRFIFVLVDQVVISNLFKGDLLDIKDLSNVLLGVFIWIPYLNKSRRVQKTFLRLYDGIYLHLPKKQALQAQDRVSNSAE